MGFFLIALAVAAVAIVGLGLLDRPNDVTDITDTLPPSDVTPDVDSVLPDTVRPQSRPEDLNTEVPEVQDNPISSDLVDEGASGEVTQEQENITDCPTPAHNQKEDGINRAYFAEEQYKKEGVEAGNGTTYTFRNDKSYTENGDPIAGDVAFILRQLTSKLDPLNEYITERMITKKLSGQDFDKDQEVSFNTYKKTLGYVKIPSAPLGSEVYIIAETTNLDAKEVTITIQEKEELLAAADAPLPVLEVPEDQETQEETTTDPDNSQEEEQTSQTEENIDNVEEPQGGGASGSWSTSQDEDDSTLMTLNETNQQQERGLENNQEQTKNYLTLDEVHQQVAVSDTATQAPPQQEENTEAASEDGVEAEDAEENEITEIRAIVDEGIAKKKIKLRPKSAEEFQRWTEILKGGVEDGMHTYEVQGEFSVTGDADTIATRIKNRSNEALIDHIVKKEDILELLIEGSTYNTSTSFVFPKYKKGSQTEFLWLKVHAQGEEEEYNEEFLKPKENDEEDDVENENDPCIKEEDNEYFRIGKNKDIIFPLLVKPLNDIEGPNKKDYWAEVDDASNQTIFAASRGGGTRKHAARDLETNPFTTVVAIAVGEVLMVKYFYENTWQITILHEIPDGRKFIVRYGELDADIENHFNIGDSVEQGQVLGKTGDLRGITRFMIHFELYSGEEGYDLTKPLTNGSSPFRRRADLIDPLAILQEGYRNTFGGGGFQEARNYNKQDAIDGLRVIYDNYGLDMSVIVEKMYRLETGHFTSLQYRLTGTGGMEVNRSNPNPPHYGWNFEGFFERYPQYSLLGTTSMREGVGLSQVGGNVQNTTNDKQFIVFSSVEAAMMYKVDYIERYDGNYARWFGTDESTQQVYRDSLINIKREISDSFVQ